MQSTGADVTSRTARMEPQIRFCSTTDGVRIAFGVTGDDSTPGILVPSLLSPTRLIAHDPVYRAMAEREAAALRRRMVFFDRRGTGLSEREVEDFRREVLVRDVEAVADHLRLPPALVVGIDSACGVAVEFAVRHPERVSHLVLFAPFRRGRDIGTPEGRDLVMSSLRNVENIGAELMSVFVVPGADPGFARRYATVRVMHGPHGRCPARRHLR
jgi:pimeloyl-ACP methyl ester carboxylesterase